VALEESRQGKAEARDAEASGENRSLRFATSRRDCRYLFQGFEADAKGVGNMYFYELDSEQRQAQNNGAKFTVFSVATQRSRKNAEDEWFSEWHRLAVICN
jgi:hypothetical protein